MSSSIPPRDEHADAHIQSLLDEARRLEDNGDFTNAARYYREAMYRLPQGDPLRERLQSTVEFLDQRPPRGPVPEDEVQPERPGRVIPIWAWGALVLCLFATLALVAGGALLSMRTGTASIPKLSGVAPALIGTPLPTVPAPAAAPTVRANATSVPPPRALFQDSFNRGNLDASRWTYENRANTVLDLSQGLFQIKSGATHNAYVYSRTSPFPAVGSFKVDIRYRHPQVGTCGTPIVLSNFVLPPGTSKEEADRQSAAAEANGVSIWFWHNMIYYRSGPAREDISTSSAPQNWHEATVTYNQNKYNIALDGVSLYTSPTTTARPQVIWFGLAFDLPNTCNWDTLQVQQVQVTGLP